MEKSAVFRRKLDAERKVRDVEKAKEDGSYVDPAQGRRPVSEIVEEWYTAAAPSLKPKTRASYRGLIDRRVVPYLGNREVGSLRPSDVQAWVNALRAEGLSASRVRQAHIVLGQALDSAVRDSVIARNPARRAGVKLPKLERREAAWLEPEQVAHAAEGCQPPYGLLILLLGQTGLRWGEAVALRRRSVDLLGRALLVTESLAEVGGEVIFGSTKSHAERRVPLTPSLAAALQSHLESLPADPTCLLFTSPSGFTLNAYGHIFDADLDALGERLEAVVAAPKTGQRRDNEALGQSSPVLVSERKTR